MKFTQFKKWFSVMAFAMTALFVTQTVRAETSPYVLMQQASDKLFADIKSNQAKIKKDPNYLRTIVRNDLLPYVHPQQVALEKSRKLTKFTDVRFTL